MKSYLSYLPFSAYCLASILLFSLPACNLSRWTNDEVKIKITPTLVAPLAKGALSIDDQPAIGEINYNLSFVLDIGVSSPVPIPVPPFNNRTSEPANFTINEPVFSEMGVADFAFVGTFTNPFGITINQGAVISISNQGSSTPFITHTTTRSIAPRGTYTFNVRATNFVVRPNLVLRVSNVSSPGSVTPVDVSNNRVNVDFVLQFPKLNYVDFPPGSVNRVEYVGEFELGLNNDDRFEGNIRLKFENRIPLNMIFNIFFLESNQTTVVGQLTNPPIVLLQGTANNPYKTSAMINATNILQDSPRIKFIRARADFSVPNSSPTIRIDKTHSLGFQLIGDLKGTLELGEK